MTLANLHPLTWIEKYPYDHLADLYKTPYYLYNIDLVRQRVALIKDAFGKAVELFYAVKANPNIKLLHNIADIIDGVDVASKGEIELSIKSGIDANNISFAGPGKTISELKSSLTQGIGFISVESLTELYNIENLVQEGYPKANILLRINPTFYTKEFAIKMGGGPSQFGIDEECITEAIEYIKPRTNVFEFLGIHVYSGTQCLSGQHLAQNLHHTLHLAKSFQDDHGLICKVINIGGGFGVPYYDKQVELDIKETAKLFIDAFHNYNEKTGSDPRIILELGRYLVADAGIYVAQVVGEKKSRGEHFFVLDGGMNHHLAASGNLGATIRKNYQVCNLSNLNGSRIECSLVGPLCTPMDMMAKKILIAKPKIGDLIGFLYSGSYGYSASPLLFLGHELPKELIAINEQIDP